MKCKLTPGLSSGDWNEFCSRFHFPPDDLPHIQILQFTDQPGPQKKTDDQSGYGGIDRPKGDVAEDIEIGVGRMQRIKKMIKHLV